VEIVKGPSAAVLYGTDAANGVIQYRTKQGQPGPTRWTAYVDGGTLNDVTDYPSNYFSERATGRSCLLTSMARGLCTIAKVDSFTGGATLNFRPWSFLTMNGTAGYDVTNQGDNELTPPNVIPLSTAQLQGNATQNRTQTFAYTANAAATASFRLSSDISSNTT